ncbi:MAG TPA: hypothetical protein VLY03_02190 [Bacteroidota bacterium]|nr:hypothetical protein [Bacteroidota bacterium]
MKKLLLILMVCGVSVGNAQFKSQLDEQTSASQSLVHPAPTISSLLGFFNPANFSMRQNLSYSYISAGGSGLSVASYTNSMFYKIADPLNVRFDLTLQGTPFGASTPFQSALNGAFLSRAEVNYQPWKNVFLQLQYNRLPLTYWGMYNPWYDNFPANDAGGDR